MAADLELYRVFAEVARAGSISKGAKKLYITQPAASQAVRRLEEQLGSRLLVRGRKGVSLTQEGQLVYSHAVSALSVLAAGEERLRRVQDLEDGQLKLGAADTITKEFLLPYLSAFRQLYPGVQLKVTNRTSLQLLELLRQGELDLAVVNLPVRQEGLEVKPILAVHDIFIAGHRYAHLQGRTLTAAELAVHPLVMLEREANSRRYVEEWFTAQGIALKPEIELGAHDLLPDFAAIGFGLACVEEEFCQAQLKAGNVFPVRLEPPIPPRHVGACWLSGLPLARAARELLNLMQGS